jgi:triosephosphate isomerase
MDKHRIPLLVANWKSNNMWEDTERFTQQLREALPQYFTTDAELPLDLVVCPAALYVGLLGSLLDSAQIFLGAQAVSGFGPGAYTGEISAEMLADNGCDFAIVGHSERRQLFGEDERTIPPKLSRLREQEIVPILCIGEDSETRESGSATRFVLGQLESVVDELKKFSAGEFVIAYEPIWAIGTGRNAGPDDAEEMAGEIRRWIGRALSDQHRDMTLVLYGGSVKPDNIAEYLACPQIDGALVGGASLGADSFAALTQACTGLIESQS